MGAVQDEIIGEMAGLEDALKRYEYLVGVGRALAAPPESIRTPEHAVPGCQSQVWIRARLETAASASTPTATP
jgi:cysteine desulfuration protein SufE